MLDFDASEPEPDRDQLDPAFPGRQCHAQCSAVDANAHANHPSDVYSIGAAGEWSGRHQQWRRFRVCPYR